MTGKKIDKHTLQVIIPIVTTQVLPDVKREVSHVLAPDFEARYHNVDSGTCFIESRYAEFLNTQAIIELAKQAEKDGCAGIFVDCFGSPGVSVVRELVNIPVVGGFDGAVLMASAIAQRFSIVTVLPAVCPMLEEQARALGITQNLASIRNVEMPVKDLKDKNKLIAHLLKESEIAIRQEGAQAIVLGCTGMVDVVDAVKAQLQEKGLPAPVIDPSYAAISLLQSLVRCGLSQSPLCYFPSHAKLVTDPSACSL
ncbi:MAG: aspartate/glutamate racemase family protein [Oleiphilaceae bacterium]|nr:aspartate/glutamate racemase family protein [Oleiphilaceae bacterium]